MTFSALSADLLATLGSGLSDPVSVVTAAPAAMPQEPADISPALSDFGSFLELVGSLVDGEEVAIGSTSFLVELPSPPAGTQLAVPLGFDCPVAHASARVESLVNRRRREVSTAGEGATPGEAPSAGVLAAPVVPAPLSAPALSRSSPDTFVAAPQETAAPRQSIAPMADGAGQKHVHHAVRNNTRPSPERRPLRAPTAFVADIAQQLERAPAEPASTTPAAGPRPLPEPRVAMPALPPQPAPQQPAPTARPEQTPETDIGLVDISAAEMPDASPDDGAANPQKPDPHPLRATPRASSAPPKRSALPTAPEQRPADKAEPAVRVPAAAPPVAAPEPAAAAERNTTSATRATPLRSPEAAPVAEQPEPQTRPVREVVIRITGGAGERVEVQVTERAGAVRVHVRSADVDLTTALRHNLGELVRSITEKGLGIETWTPAETWPALTPVPGSDAAIGVPETFFSGEHTPSNGDQHRHSSEQDGRSQRSPGARLEDSGTADEHRRGRAREQWFEEFERRLRQELSQ